MELSPWCLVFRIRSSVDFNGLNIVCSEINSDIEDCREECEVKLLNQICLHILLLGGT